MKKAIVTGANGFIGKHLVDALLLNNIETYAIIYPGSLYQDTDPKLHIIEMDLNNILEHIEDFPTDIDILYHFAWIGVRPELRNDLEVQMSNINMSLDCMKFAIAIHVKKIIFPGSTNEYLYYGKPLNKDAVPSPNNSYGAAKIALRYLCSDFATRNDIEFIYTIIAGIYAADRRDNNVIFYTIEKLLHGEKPSLTKLEQKWDYVYIDDVIDALLAIGRKGQNGKVYAIGHGDNWALSNYIRIIHELIDPALPLGIGDIPYDCEILPSSCVDLSEITTDTGFIPRVPFEVGIKKVINKLKEDMKNE